MNENTFNDDATSPSETSHHAKVGMLSEVAMKAAREMVMKGAGGFTIIAGEGANELTHIRFGRINDETQFPVASASKWLTAVAAIRVAEEMQVSLEEPISTFLPFVQGRAAQITLRHLLSQTSGLCGSNGERFDINQDHRITLAQSADEVTARPLISEPGEVFAYGGPGFQVIGAAMEAITGKRWAELFYEMIAKPLGLTRTYWTHLKLDRIDELPVSETLNPVLQGGVVCTASDYARFLSMLAQDGVCSGVRLLSTQSIDLLFSDHTPFAHMTPTGANVLTDAHYSLGSWCETWDANGVCDRNSSIGLFGAYPWLEKRTKRYGLIFICQRDDAFRLWPEMQIIRDALLN